MTSPTPNNRGVGANDRKKWFLTLLALQATIDVKIKTILTAGAVDAEQKINELSDKNTFSASVRAAQIRLILREVKTVLDDTFKSIIPVVKQGQQNAAKKAAISFSETDKNYLRAAFGSTGAANKFIAAQSQQAQIHVAQAVSHFNQWDDHPLSARVYTSQALAFNWVKRDVTVGIMRGDSAKDIAKVVKKHIRPDVPGGVSYAAMRLARTEINNAFHATAVNLAKDRPWVEGMRWHLSGTHERTPGDLCERYAGQIFDLDNVPKKPHPQCRCFITPELEAEDVFMRHLVAGQYRDWTQNAA